MTDAEALSLPFDEAIEYFRQKLRTPTAHWTDVWQEAHSRAFMVAGAATDALLEDFQDAIKKALADGTTLEEFRRDFAAIVDKHGWSYNGSPGWRSRIIYETNLSTAYSAGRYAQLTQPATLDAFPYWQYVHGDSMRPRPQHLAWNGLTLRADDPFWSTHYPPNGWRCSCRVRPISGADLGRMGKAGPDDAPPPEYRDWRNPHTGAVHKVPVGIDPGFGYNPGKAWDRLPVKAPDLVPVGPEPPVQKTPVPAKAPKSTEPRSFPTIQAADKHWSDLAQPIFETWSEKASAALDNYKGQMGRAMNAALRGEIDTGRMAPEIEALSDALSRAIVPEAALVHRGIGRQEAAIYNAAKVGEIVARPDFTSTTLSRDVADRIGNSGVVEIRVPAGYRGGLYVHHVPKFRYRQYELLLKPGAKFKVIRNDGGSVVLEVQP